MLDAARQCVVDHGLSGASLRLIAQQAGVSVGSLSYNLGDRAELIEALRTHEMAALAERHGAWFARSKSLGVPDDGQVADLVASWLDDEARNHRAAAITCCELVLQAARARTGEIAVLDRSEGFWRELLAGRSDADHLGPLLARYCLDELPFSILLGDDPDYRLLRAATIAPLLGQSAEATGRPEWHDQIVDRLGAAVRPVTDGTGLLAKPQKAVLAGFIANLIENEGLAVLTHRRIAQLADVPASTIAHHFPQQRDLVLGGIEAAYDRMRRSIRSVAGETTASSTVVILLTHEMALAALRDSGLRPFAIDMRRRRGENVRDELARAILPGRELGGALVQALVMTMIGGMIGLRAGGLDARDIGAWSLAAYRAVIEDHAAHLP